MEEKRIIDYRRTLKKKNISFFGKFCTLFCNIINCDKYDTCIQTKNSHKALFKKYNPLIDNKISLEMLKTPLPNH